MRFERILIDGNNLAYAAQSASPLSYEGRPVHAIFHFLKMLKTIAFMYEDDAPIISVLWDTKAQWRYDIYPEYKGKRKEDLNVIKAKEEMASQLPVIRKAISLLSVSQAIGEGYEADDLAGMFTKKFTAYNQPTLLVSGDKDWIQLVNPIVEWYDPIRNRRVTRRTFEEFTGFSNVQAFVESKALEGDSSDCIDGVAGIGEKTSRALLNHFGSIYNLIGYFDDNGKVDLDKEFFPEGAQRARKKINEFLHNGRDTLDRNMKLMDLRNVPIDVSKIKITKGNMDMLAFRELCHEHAFQSIVRELHAWERIFGARK